jgi:hypothetical protein
MYTTAWMQKVEQRMEQLPRMYECDEQGWSNVTSKQGCLFASDPRSAGTR